MLVKRLIFAPIIFVLLLTACSADQLEPPTAAASPTSEALALEDAPVTLAPTLTSAPPPSATPLPTVEPIDKPTPSAEPATPTVQPSPTGEPEPLLVISGQTAEGAFFLGAVDAPVTVIDYSDFL